MLKVGCQTYTWEMLGDKWTGTVDDILDLVAAAGYAGDRDHQLDDPRICRPAG